MDGAERAVKFDDASASRFLVKAIDILRHNRLHDPAPLPIGQQAVSVMRLALLQCANAILVKLDERFTAMMQCIDGREFDRIETRPQPGARRTEIGQPAFR